MNPLPEPAPEEQPQPPANLLTPEFQSNLAYYTVARNRLPLDQIIHQYIVFICAERASRTAAIYNGILLKLLSWAKEHHYNECFQERHFNDYSRHILSRYKSQHKRAFETTIIQIFFKWSVRKEYLPMEFLYTRVHEEFPASTKRVPVTSQEYNALIEHMKKRGSYDRWPGVFVRILWETGMRKSDAQLLRWSDIDLREGVITIHPKKTRRMKPNPVHIPITSEFRNFLAKYKNDTLAKEDSPVFRHTYDHAACGNNTSNQMRILAGIIRPFLQRKTLHNFRCSFISRAIAAGISPDIICSMTGHSINSLKPYISVPIDVKAQAMAKMSRTKLGRFS